MRVASVLTNITLVLVLLCLSTQWSVCTAHSFTSLVEVCASSVNSSLELQGVDWNIKEHVAIHTVHTRTLYTPDFAEHFKFVYSLDDRKYAVDQGKVFNNVAVGSLPVGSYSWVLTSDGDLSFGRLENSWEFGVKHIHLANGRSVLIAGELMLSNEVCDDATTECGDISVLVNIISGTYTLPLTKNLSELIGGDTPAALQVLRECAIAVMNTQQQRLSTLTMYPMRQQNSSKNKVSISLDTGSHMRSFNPENPILVSEVQSICINDAKFRVKYKSVCTKYSPWKTNELQSMASELKDIALANIKIHGSELQWLQLSSADKADVTVYNAKVVSAAVEATKSSPTNNTALNPRFPTGMLLVGGRRYDSLEGFEWNGPTLACKLKHKSSHARQFYISSTSGLAYTLERGLYNVTMLTPTRPACLQEKFELLLDNITRSSEHGTDTLDEHLVGLLEGSNSTERMRELRAKYDLLSHKYPWPRRLLEDFLGISSLCDGDSGGGKSTASNSSPTSTTGRSDSKEHNNRYLRRKLEGEDLHHHHHHHHHNTSDSDEPHHHHHHHDTSDSNDISDTDHAHVLLSISSLVSSPPEKNLFLTRDDTHNDKDNRTVSAREGVDDAAYKRIQRYGHCILLLNQFGEPFIVSDAMYENPTDSFVAWG